MLGEEWWLSSEPPPEWCYLNQGRPCFEAGFERTDSNVPGVNGLPLNNIIYRLQASEKDAPPGELNAGQTITVLEHHAPSNQDDQPACDIASEAHQDAVVIVE